jgi:hypothetical protein
MLYCHNVTHNVIFFTFCKEFFVVDDDSGLSAIGLVCEQTEFYDDSGRSPLAD